MDKITLKLDQPTLPQVSGFDLEFGIIITVTLNGERVHLLEVDEKPRTLFCIERFDTLRADFFALGCVAVVTGILENS